MSIVTELSSGTYEGRMCGTKGNDLALAYVAKRFADGHLAPLPGLKSFRQEFETYVPRLRSTPILQVLDRSRKVVKSYVHRTDFREITAGLAGSGDVKGGFRTAATVGEIGAGRSGIFLLTNEAYQVEDDYALRSSGLKALIVQNPDNIVRRKSLSLLGRPRDGRGGFVKVFVAPRVMKELIAYGKRGCQIRVKVDFSVDRVRTANVVGLLEGKASQATRRILVLSAHLDHIGRDPSGQVFPGALDNASGTAVMLTILQSLAKLGVRPGWTIVFAALNAEESMLGGSDHLASNWPFSANAAEVLNLDMLGSREVDIISCLTASEAVSEEEKAMMDRLRLLASGPEDPIQERGESFLGSRQLCRGRHSRRHAQQFRRLPYCSGHRRRDRPGTPRRGRSFGGRVCGGEGILTDLLPTRSLRGAACRALDPIRIPHPECPVRLSHL